MSLILASAVLNCQLAPTGWRGRSALAVAPDVATTGGLRRLRHAQSHEQESQAFRQAYRERPRHPVGTITHPVWSATRQAWVPLGELAIGEEVQAETGVVTLTAAARLLTAQPVYNLEVHTEHVYQVGESGILVHNVDCLDFANDTLNALPDGVVMRMDPNRTPFIGELPGYPVPGQPTSMMDKHFFHIQDGILRGPAHPGGISVDEWIRQYSELNNIPIERVMDFVRFTPRLN